MAGTVAPPPNKYRQPLGEAMRAQARRAVQAPVPEPDVAAPVVRVVCVVLAGGYALNQWLKLVETRPAHALALATVLAAALGAALLGITRLDRAVVRHAATAGALIVALLAALAVAGAPGSSLFPRGWGDLAAGIGHGLGALPGLTVPYRGTDTWARVVLAVGGVLLLLAAVAAAAWPRRRAPGSRLGALAALGLLYAVPAVELTFDHPWGVGLVFAVLLVAAMHAERLRPARAAHAAGFVALAALAAVILGPRIDGSGPIVDVQKLASSLESGHEITFTWNHSYGPLHWPRDGRVLLRVKARHQAYWKAETLDEFDGTRWVGSPDRGYDQYFTTSSWTQQITVTIGALRTSQFIGAGTTVGINDSPRIPVGGTPGTQVAKDAPLESGDSYRATVYYPQPSDHDERVAGTNYPPTIARDLVVQMPGALPESVFAPWGQPESESSGLAAQSPYARAYALAKRLKARSRTPYDYVNAIEDYLSRGFHYDEHPPVRRYPLEAFLFRDHRGYCQQFSGAMALLLRMGGVPARVAAGFSPGVQDPATGEFVVRDFDAHSWVEAFFPQIGWVTFDPTPSVAPPRSQLDDAVATPSPAGDRPTPTGRSTPTAAEGGRARVRATPTPWWRHPLLLVPVALLVLGVVALVLALRRERRSHPPTAPELAELERALRRTGRDPRPPATLSDLERLLGPDPDASDYLVAVRRQRYGGSAEGPTAAERAALRRALGDGLGVEGRLRALWALPPRRGGRRSLH